MFKKMVVFSVLMAILMLSSQAYAYKRHERGRRVHTRRAYCYHYHRSTPATKLAGGVSKVATSWIEIPMSIAEYSQEYDPITGITLGTGVGASRAVAKAAEGSIETAFFLFPPYDERSSKNIFSPLNEWDKKFKEYWW